MKTKLPLLALALFAVIGVTKAQCTMTTPANTVFSTPGSYSIAASGPMYIQICPNVVVYDTLGSNQRKYYLLPGAHVVFKGGFNNFAYMQGNSTYARLGTNGATNFVYAESGATISGALTTTNSCTAVVFPTVSCTSSTGIKEYTEAGLISVFPNPANGMVNVINDHAEEMVASIVNSVGEVERVIVLSKGLNSIDIYGMAEGIYFISVSAADGTIARGKIVVTR
jgi:hypothetical protein